MSPGDASFGQGGHQWPLCSSVDRVNSRFYESTMKVVGRIFFTYLLVAMSVAGAGYLLTLPWSAP